MQRHLGVDHAPEQDELLRRVNLLTAQQCRQLVKQSKDRDSAVVPQVEENFTAQVELAQEMLAMVQRRSLGTLALQVFTINHQAGRTQETTAGVWRLSGKHYISSYDSESQQFLLESRHMLAKVLLWGLALVGIIIQLGGVQSGLCSSW